MTFRTTTTHLNSIDTPFLSLNSSSGYIISPSTIAGLSSKTSYSDSAFLKSEAMLVPLYMILQKVPCNEPAACCISTSEDRLPRSPTALRLFHANTSCNHRVKMHSSSTNLKDLPVVENQKWRQSHRRSANYGSIFVRAGLARGYLQALSCLYRILYNGV